MLFDDRGVANAEAERVDPILADAAARSRSEEEFRIAAVTAIRDVAARVGVALDLRAEVAIAAGRADAAYNRVVIEFERPGVLRASLDHAGTAHAVRQVQDYLEGFSTQLGVALTDLLGIVMDGNWYVFVRSVAGEWRIDGPLARNPTTTARFLRQLLALGSGRALTARNLVEDFGSTSRAAAEGISALYRALFEPGPGAGLRDALFDEWLRLFGAISGVSATEIDARAARALAPIARHAGLGTPDAARLLFTLHTYFAIVTKLIAYAAVGRQAAPIGLGLRDWVGLDDASLRHRVRDLERGGLFRQLGLRNFLEGDFFGWYVPCWTPQVAAAIRTIADALDEYDPGSLEARPELTRDLLKGLYQYLMPRHIRHDLGEYYTPDWLADFVLDRANYTGGAGERFLDPACGSGTFLVLAIARMRARADAEGQSERNTLHRILADVVGLDLNPLAVIAARANYVLALGDLLVHRNTDIDIPVYLADSVRPPTVAPGLFDSGVYRVELAVETFELPAWVTSQRDIEAVSTALDEAVNNRLPTESFLERIEGLASGAVSDADRRAIEASFHRLAELHETGRNGVWARVLKNAFMPLFVGRFSHVVGNPPWIAWENLSARYRDATAPLWDYYRLHPAPAEMALPSKRTRNDMAVLMTYVAADRYLAPGGTLAFLITQSVFKSEAAGRGFRRFALPNGDELSVTHVDDFTDFQPFEAATNRTGFIAMTHGRTEYPVAYHKWRTGRASRTPSDELTSSQFRSLAVVEEWQATPVLTADRGSPWLTGPPAVVAALRAAIGQSAYRALAKEGANTRGANGVFWVERTAPQQGPRVLVRNYAEGGRGRAAPVVMAVETARLYPLLRGRDVRRWRGESQIEILLPYDPGDPGRPISQRDMASTYPLAQAYLAAFHDALVGRRPFRNFNPRQNIPWEMYNVGAYSFAPYKVVWREQATGFTAALALPHNGQPVVPDHKLFSVGLADAEDAAFLAAVLNSTPVRVLVDLYALDLSISSHLLDYARVPRYDATDGIHRELARLGHEAYTALLPGELDRIERAVDEASRGLWGLTREQMSALQSFDAGLVRENDEEDAAAE